MEMELETNYYFMDGFVVSEELLYMMNKNPKNFKRASITDALSVNQTYVSLDEIHKNFNSNERLNKTLKRHPSIKTSEIKEDQDKEVSTSKIFFKSSVNTDPKFMIFKFTNAEMQELNTNLRIKQNLKNSKETFIDPEFPPGPSRLGYSEKFLRKMKDVNWLPLTAFSRNLHKLKVFSDDLKPSSVKQGMVGDCYFLSVLSALTTKPYLIKRLFSSKEIDPLGCYSVWLCLSGNWKNIILDDCFPCWNGEPCFARLVNDELWPLLLEKAYAKAYGSYEAIERGHTIDVIHMITGAPSEYVELAKGNGWAKLKYAFSRNYLVTASSMEGGIEYSDFEVNALGIVPSHCYAVLDMFEMITNKGINLRRLKLRNPWGKDYCKIRCDWSQEMVEHLGNAMRKQENQGELWMDLESFQNFFTAITINKVDENYYNAFKIISSKDYRPFGNWSRLIVLEKSHLYISLNQLDKRNFISKPGASYDYSPAKIFLLKSNWGSWEILIAEHDNMRFISVETTLEPGEYYLISRISWNKMTYDYTISTYSDNPLILEEFQPISKFDIESSEILETNFRNNMSRFSSNFKTESLQNHGEIILLHTTGEIFGYRGILFDNISKDYIINIEIIPEEFFNMKWIGELGHQEGDLKFIIMPQTSKKFFFTPVTVHAGYAYRFNYNFSYKRFY